MKGVATRSGKAMNPFSKLRLSLFGYLVYAGVAGAVATAATRHFAGAAEPGILTAADMARPM